MRLANLSVRTISADCFGTGSAATDSDAVPRVLPAKEKIMASQPPPPEDIPADTPVDIPVPSPTDPEPYAPSDPVIPGLPG